MRGTTASKNASGNYNFYCRSCGLVMEQKDMPTICKFCGSILIDAGIAISGDNSVSETSASAGYANRGHVIVDVDKKVH